MSARTLSSTSRDVASSATRRTRARIAVAVGVCISTFVSACDRSASPGASDSTQPAGRGAAAPSTGTTTAGAGWSIDAGAFLVLPTVDGGMTSGSFLRPDATELTVGDTVGVRALLGDGDVELFSRGGQVGRARLSVEASPKVDQGCTAWPVARLGAATSPMLPWTAAFAAGHVVPVALDSIEGLPPRDSSRMAIDLTRLASALKDDTVATFRGLPFVVLRAWRSKGLTTDFIVATLARRVNQEDSPREERLVVVVDQTGTDAKQWSVAWHERASGHEEELVVAEPLLAFQVKRNAGASQEVHLLFGRDDGVALGAAILSRSSVGWRVLWESAVAGCD